jgi:hypothetical protein
LSHDHNYLFPLDFATGFGVVERCISLKIPGVCDTDDSLLRVIYFARSCWEFGLEGKHDFIEKSLGNRSSRRNRL